MWAESQRRFGVTVCLLALLLAACPSKPAFVSQQESGVLADSLQRAFAQSIEAEKNAVMASTDEESIAFATESRRASEEVTRLSGELRKALSSGGDHGALQKLDAFDTAWSKVAEMDARILPLAVANTNLKASRLSSEEGTQALDGFVNALDKAATVFKQVEPVREVMRASVAAMKIQTLHAPHIAAAEDAVMTALEAQVHGLEGAVDASLLKLKGGKVKGSEAPLEEAEGHWKEYQRLTMEVFRLSRQNTNVISLQLSTHEKRDVTKPCEVALAGLIAEIDAAASHPTR